MVIQFLTFLFKTKFTLNMRFFSVSKQICIQEILLSAISREKVSGDKRGRERESEREREGRKRVREKERVGERERERERKR